MSKALEKLAEPISRPGSRLTEHEEVQLHPVLQLQRLAGNQAVLGLMTSSGPMVQRKCATCTGTSKCSSCEEEERLQRKPKNDSLLSSTSLHIQRAPNNGNPSATPAETVTTGPLIVDDDAANIQPGQMRKSEFLEQLRSTVCTTADAALVEAGQSTEGCPYIEQWFSYYAEQEPAHIERALRKYAPEANNATTAADYIPAVSNRVRDGVQHWARTGEIPDAPPELAGMLPGAGGALGAVAGVIGGALAGIGSAIGGAFSSIGQALFKRKEGSAPSTDDPQSIQSQLNGGQPLAAGSMSRLGAAFGHDFSDVRVHTGASAAGLSQQLNARAFTIGSDIAFGAGEYQPGTLIGDALIAHELAHVVQQRGDSNGSAMSQSKGEAAYDALEEEADVAAVGAVVSAWDGPESLLAGQSTMPRLRSGLRLQRCESCGGTPTAATPTAPTTGTSAGAELSCPELPETTSSSSEPATPSTLDARALAIIAIAQDTSRPASERAVAVVTHILCQYYSSQVSKVTEIYYQSDLNGLLTTRVGTGSTARGRWGVGDYFLTQTQRTHFARRVLQVGHELQHIDQYRAGMIGETRSTEREFLAHSWTALEPEVAGTGRMPDATRRAVFDQALRCFNCLPDELKEQYADRRRLLLERRELVNGTRGNARTEPPTDCGGCD